MERPKTAEEAARDLADALERRGIDYAVGGALALAEHGVVRGTKDVDLNVWVDPAKPTAAVKLLTDLGCELRASAAIREFTDKGWAYARFQGVRVDVYLPLKDFHESARLRRCRRPLRGRDAWFLSAEDLAVCKLIIHRAKDRADLQAMVTVQGRALDASYVRDWIVRLCGARDGRLSTWDALVEMGEEAQRLRERGWKPPHLEDESAPTS
jgi:hypothetical protein